MAPAGKTRACPNGSQLQQAAAGCQLPSLGSGATHAASKANPYLAAMFPIIDVTSDAGQLEPMGSKPKFWFEHAEWGACLFKTARPGSGEDWSEKLAEQPSLRVVQWRGANNSPRWRNR